MSTVRLPPYLRSHAGGEKEVEASGSSVGELLNDLISRHPGMADQLLTADGSLHRFVNIFVNGQDVRYMSLLDTPVGDRDKVVILPAMAGG
jgi:sulfur-carrier protein